MHKFWVGWRLWWTGLATCTNAVPQRLTWSEYLMEASVQGILQYVLQSDMSCHGSLSELELVVSRWFCGVGDPCGWGCWHFWLQLAQVHRSSDEGNCKMQLYDITSPSQIYFWLTETAAQKDIPAPKMSQMMGPTIKFLYCYSWGYQKVEKAYYAIYTQQIVTYFQCHFCPSTV